MEVLYTGPSASAPGRGPVFYSATAHGAAIGAARCRCCHCRCCRRLAPRCPPPPRSPASAMNQLRPCLISNTARGQAISKPRHHARQDLLHRSARSVVLGVAAELGDDKEVGWLYLQKERTRKRKKEKGREREGEREGREGRERERERERMRERKEGGGEGSAEGNRDGVRRGAGYRAHIEARRHSPDAELGSHPRPQSLGCASSGLSWACMCG